MATRQVRGLAPWRPSLSVFVLLNVLDLMTTWLAMSLGMREGNPLPSLFLTLGGPGAVLGFKIISVVAVAGMVLRLGRSFPAIWRGLMFSNFLLGLIVLSNSLQLLTA